MKTPSRLSVALSDGILRMLVDKDSPLPIENKHTLSTFEDNQTSVPIQIVYGDNVFIGDNTKLAEYLLDNIPPMPKRVPRIEISFRINTDLILNVKTTILDNGYAKEYEGIDLSQLIPPKKINPTAGSWLEDVFVGFGMKVKQPAPESTDFAKCINRLGSDDEFRQLFFKSREQALSNYDLDNEQVQALEIITPEIIISVGRRTLLVQMQNIVNFTKNNPNATRCSFCKGLGLIVNYDRNSAGMLWSYAKCNNCSGVGFVK